MALSLGNMITIGLRLISNRGEIERLIPKILEIENSIKQAMNTVGEVHDLAAKIAPELIAPRPSRMEEPKYDVKWLQTSLNRLINAGLDVDGQYGALTKAAVENFQKQNGLTVDGWAGALTEAKILQLLTEREKTS